MRQDRTVSLCEMETSMVYISINLYLLFNAHLFSHALKENHMIRKGFFLPLIDLEAVYTQLTDFTRKHSTNLASLGLKL